MSPPPVGLSLKRLVHHKLNEPPPPPFPGYANHVKKGDENYSDYSRCLKITEKVSFSIASEASYVYILSGQKFIKNVKNGQLTQMRLFW